jgi:23S rRNA (uracil1939-C5)-methyltransferase
VFAADSDKAAVAALNAATKPARGLKPIEARMRDLFREPLSATELRDFECVVFDPPRAGADAQARMIARSKVKTVVAVSCSPATLARDARMLLDGGYKIKSVTPLDQFQYSPHIEAVAVFRR